MKALEAGCHVFVEKPLATTVADAERVVAAAKANGRKLVVGYILRHHPSWIRLIAEARKLGGPYVFRMNLNQQSSGPTWDTHKQLMQTTSPIVDCGVHYLDVMCQITDAKPVEVRGMGLRLTDEIDPQMYNYGHLQVLFDDGSVGWYEAGWGPMMSETAFFVKDVISPNGCVSIVMNEGAKSDDIDTHTKTQMIRVHRAKTGKDGKFASPDQDLSMKDEPDHQGLCDREQAFLLKAIREDFDLTRHMDDAVKSLAVCLAADESVQLRQGRQAIGTTDQAVGSLKIENVKKSFGKVEVLKGIDLEVQDGEFVVFVGPSGCGKSTLLRVIAGLEDATSGDVRIDGQSVIGVPPAKRGIAMVFQTYALYPHLTVKNNMSLGLKQINTPAAEIERRVAAASAMLSLEPYLERRPAELSGGQRQRVAIGRAVVREPKLFLFDEPLSNLDAALRVNTRLEIAQLHRRLSATMIYVTHDQVEAMTLADRIVVMNAGRVEQVGAPMELYNAAGKRIRGELHRLAEDEFHRRRAAWRRPGEDRRRAARAPDRRRGEAAPGRAPLSTPSISAPTPISTSTRKKPGC